MEWRLGSYRTDTAGQATGDVLEIGGGTGANLRYYPPEARLTFVEPSPYMARRLVRRAAGLGREVALVDGTGEWLPFPDGSFDSVVITLVLCSVGDLHGVVREARRVFREDGRFYFYEHVVASGPWKRVLQRIFRRPWRLLIDGCHLDRDIERAVWSAGFREITVRSFDLSVGVLVTLRNVVGVALEGKTSLKRGALDEFDRDPAAICRRDGHAVDPLPSCCHGGRERSGLQLAGRGAVATAGR